MVVCSDNDTTIYTTNAAIVSSLPHTPNIPLPGCSYPSHGEESIVVVSNTSSIDGTRSIVVVTSLSDYDSGSHHTFSDGLQIKALLLPWSSPPTSGTQPIQWGHSLPPSTTPGGGDLTTNFDYVGRAIVLHCSMSPHISLPPPFSPSPSREHSFCLFSGEIWWLLPQLWWLADVSTMEAPSSMVLLPLVVQDHSAGFNISLGHLVSLEPCRWCIFIWWIFGIYHLGFLSIGNHMGSQCPLAEGFLLLRFLFIFLFSFGYMVVTLALIPFILGLSLSFVSFSTPMWLHHMKVFVAIFIISSHLYLVAAVGS
jgi:hypothetical protein